MLIGDRDTADQAIAHGIDRLLKEALGASETVIGEVFGAYLRYGTACQKWLVELDSGELALRDEWDAASCFSLQLSRLWSDTEDRLIHAALQSVAREGTTVH